MKKRSIGKYCYFLGILAFLFAWDLLASRIGEKNLLLPGVKETLTSTFELLKKPYLYRCLAATFLKMGSGFLLALVLALILGTLAGTHPAFFAFLAPALTFFKAVPTACLVFLFLYLFGAAETPVYIVFLISFPILYESISGGIRGIAVELREALALYGTQNYRDDLKVRLPLALPYLTVGISSSFALAFKIEIMAEIISGSTSYGLGSAILAAQKNDPSSLKIIFAYSLIAVFFMLLLDALSLFFAKKSAKRR